MEACPDGAASYKRGMTAPQTSHLTFGSPEETAEFAAALSTRLERGDVLLLSGHIGAGKTHFARSLIQSRLQRNGDPIEDVPSPTFTLVQTYHTGGDEIWHADLYRLTHPDEVDELGLIDAFETAICLVEWPDRLGDLAPSDALTLLFTGKNGETAPDHRDVSLHWTDSKWPSRLSSVPSGIGA